MGFLPFCFSLPPFGLQFWARRALKHHHLPTHLPSSETRRGGGGRITVLPGARATTVVSAWGFTDSLIVREKELSDPITLCNVNDELLKVVGEPAIRYMLFGDDAGI